MQNAMMTRRFWLIFLPIIALISYSAMASRDNLPGLYPWQQLQYEVESDVRIERNRIGATACKRYEAQSFIRKFTNRKLAWCGEWLERQANKGG